MTFVYTIGDVVGAVVIVTLLVAFGVAAVHDWITWGRR